MKTHVKKPSSNKKMETLYEINLSDVPKRDDNIKIVSYYIIICGLVHILIGYLTRLNIQVIVTSYIFCIFMLMFVNCYNDRILYYPYNMITNRYRSYNKVYTALEFIGTMVSPQTTNVERSSFINTSKMMTMLKAQGITTVVVFVDETISFLDMIISKLGDHSNMLSVIEQNLGNYIFFTHFVNGKIASNFGTYSRVNTSHVAKGTPPSSRMILSSILEVLSTFVLGK